MAAAATIIVRNRHRVGSSQWDIEAMGADVPAIPVLLAGTRLRRFDHMAIYAQDFRPHRVAGFVDLMIGTDNVGVTAQAEGVVGGAAELMAVGSRSMHVMTGCAGLETVAVAVLGRGNKIGVLLMMRF